MRLTVLLVTLAAAAADPPARVPVPPATAPAPDLLNPGPADAKYPLPTNRPLAADRLKKRAEWLKKQWLGDFDATADKAAAGHAEARKAVEAAAVYEGRLNVRYADALDARNRTLKSAAKAKTDEPLFWVQHTRYLSADVGDDRLTFVTDQMQGKTYSPYVRAATHRQAARDAGLQLNARDAHLARFLPAFTELAKSPDSTAAEITDELVGDVLGDDTFGQTPGDRYTRLKPALEVAGVPERVKQLALGTAWALAAWQEKPDTTIELQQAGQSAAYKAALEKAEKALTAAWTADPRQPEAAARMIEVCQGRGHPRDQMELWFKRAMTADPDCYPACVAKLDYLRWQGKDDPAELLAFGRQCARGGHPEGFVPESLFEAHKRAKGSDKADYWKKPAVWADLRAVYEPAAAALPADRQLRTRYARACLWCGHPEAADGQLRAVNDRVWLPDFADKDEAAKLRTSIDRALKKKRTADDDDQ